MTRHIRTAFMDGLVLAIAADEKTVTRRLIKGDIPADISEPEEGFVHINNEGLLCGRSRTLTMGWNGEPEEYVEWTTFPVPMRATPGDIMDVCEALVRGPKLGKVCYRADGNHTHVMVPSADGHEYPVAWPWKVKVLPARYCPTWAVRHHRRLVSVRPERLSQVTDAEAVREGIARLGWEPTREAFLRGFRQMHGLAEDADPWVERREWAPGEVQS